MANVLLATLLVLVSAFLVPDLARWRDFSWLRVWVSRVAGGGETRGGGAAVLVLPILLIALCSLIQYALHGLLFGLPSFAFALVVLFYCWGPRDLDQDVDAVLKAADVEQRIAAAQHLNPDGDPTPLPFDAPHLVDATFRSALSRWFGVLFWFALLGPAGALGYRVMQLIARDPTIASLFDAEQRAFADRAALILDWAPAHLMALTLALVSDFDAVLSTWREYHAGHGRGYFTLDLGFLSALARAGVDADVLAGDGYVVDVDNPLVELTNARTVLRRILITWVAVIAVFVLARWTH